MPLRVGDFFFPDLVVDGLAQNAEPAAGVQDSVALVYSDPLRNKVADPERVEEKVCERLVLDASGFVIDFLCRRVFDHCALSFTIQRDTVRTHCAGVNSFGQRAGLVPAH